MDLHPGEEMVFDGHPSWRGVMSFYITGSVIVAVLVVLGLLIFSTGLAIVIGIIAFALLVFVGLIKRIATRYVITTERLHIRHGILSKSTQETRVQRVQNVNTEQSVVDRILRVGTVDFDTAGADDFAKLVAWLVIESGRLEADPAALQIERLQLDKNRLDARIADAQRAGEPVATLAAERPRVQDQIRHRLV